MIDRKIDEIESEMELQQNISKFKTELDSEIENIEYDIESLDYALDTAPDEARKSVKCGEYLREKALLFWIHITVQTMSNNFKLFLTILYNFKQFYRTSNDSIQP